MNKAYIPMASIDIEAPGLTVSYYSCYNNDNTTDTLSIIPSYGSRKFKLLKYPTIPDKVKDVIFDDIYLKVYFICENSIYRTDYLSNYNLIDAKEIIFKK